MLSAHVLSDYLQQRDGIMPWYKGELLDMAKDVGYRLLPAFNTTTGIPHSRVRYFQTYIFGARTLFNIVCLCFGPNGNPL